MRQPVLYKLLYAYKDCPRQARFAVEWIFKHILEKKFCLWHLR